MDFVWTINLDNMTETDIDKAYSLHEESVSSEYNQIYREHIDLDEYQELPSFAELFTECCLLADMVLADQDKIIDGPLRSLYINFETHYQNSVGTALRIHRLLKETKEFPPTEKELSVETYAKNALKEASTPNRNKDAVKKFRNNLRRELNELISPSQARNRTMCAHDLMVLLDNITVHTAIPPHRKYLVDFEERNLGRAFLCFDLNLLETYCQKVLTFIGQTISKLQFHIYNCMVTKTYDDSFEKYIHDFIEAIKQGGQAMNPYTNPNPNVRDCMALMEFQIAGSLFYEHAFSNMYDCNDPNICKYFNVRSSKEPVYQKVYIIFKNMASIESYWSRTNINMRTYYDFHNNQLLLAHPVTIGDAISMSADASKARGHYNCCERKMLSDLDANITLNAVNRIKVFARHKICHKCVPNIIDELCGKQQVDVLMYYLENENVKHDD